MPLTPFIGLSVLVHICVIAGHKILSSLSYSKNSRKKATTRGMVAGYVIMFVVFSVVLVNAVLLVRASIHDRYSSISFASRFVSNAVAAFESSPTQATDLAGSIGNPAYAEMATTPVSKITTMQQIDETCSPRFNMIASAYQGSLADYLWLNNKGRYSMISREIMAKSFGITPYDGTYAQNRLLWMRFLVNRGDLTPKDIAPCYNQVNMVGMNY